jgi:hypothetical protein
MDAGFFNAPSTERDYQIALKCVINAATIKVLNDLQCLHRDQQTGEIHTDHPSSTGLFYPRWYW